MTLEFREYKKKIKKNIFLELDFKVSTGEILTIISNNTLELDSLKDSFKRRTKFKGEITFDNIDVLTFLIYKMYIAMIIDWNGLYKKIDDKEISDNIMKTFQ